MFKRLVLGMVSLCACAMPRGHSSGGKVRAGSPYVVAHNEEIIWVTRTLPGDEETTALFACYGPRQTDPDHRHATGRRMWALLRRSKVTAASRPPRIS